MTEPFRFPGAGELRNPEGIPMSVPDVYRLVIAAAPILVVGGESVGVDDPLNAPLRAFWNAMNALPRELRVAAQKIIRDVWGDLPSAPWEEVDGQGNVVDPVVDTSLLREIWALLNGVTE